MSGVGSDPDDHGLAEWLAAQTHADPEQVEAELALGQQRRAFVAAELVEAGYAGSELLELVMRLTGVDATTARALVDDVSAGAPEVAPSKRDERLAQNEVMFRRVNERIAAEDGDPTTPHELELVCECSDRECLKVLRIAVAEYEWVRSSPRRFVVLPGHEAPAVEDVVERHDHFVVVEKHAESHAQVEAADPRV